MRGIDFYNIPTTLLSEVDSSIGGKTAINFGGVKNIIGAFHQPKRVLIDPDVLKTLPQRQIANGLAEVIKMAATCDAELFAYLEKTPLLPTEDGRLPREVDEVIARALAIKISVVENDVREKGARRVLNFGHTLGHAIESLSGLGGLYHGECVALGMIPMCEPAVRARLLPLLARCGLPTSLDPLPDKEALIAAIGHDKKAEGEEICAVTVPRVGEYVMQMRTAQSLTDALYASFS